MRTKPLIVALDIGLAAFAAILLLGLHGLWPGHGDFAGPLCQARALLGGEDPYGPACRSYSPAGFLWAQYPLTAGLASLPFLAFGDWAGAVMFAAFSGFLAYGLVRDGPPWRLLIFASGAYWESLTVLQWSPLLAGLMLTPALLPLAIVKPHMGLPVILMRLSRWRLLGIVAFAALSLAVDPTWPLRWWGNSQTYEGHIPLLTMPFGPALLLAALRWREPDARFFLLMAAVPQRWIYDTLPLALLAHTPRQLVTFCIVSAVAHNLVSLGLRADVAIAGLVYLPVLLMLRPLEPVARYITRIRRDAPAPATPESPPSPI